MYLLRVLKLLLGPFHRLDWAEGRAQGVYLLRVLKLLLGTFRSTGRNHRAQGRAQGVYLLRVLGKAGPKESLWALFAHWAQGCLRVLKLLLGTCRSTGPKARHKESICCGSETAAGALFVPLGQGQAKGIYVTGLETAAGCKARPKESICYRS